MTAHTASLLTVLSEEVRTRIRVELREAATRRQHQLDLLAASGPEAGDETDPVLFTQRATLQQLLDQIRAAQARIDDDTFGQCQRCHAAIPLARLEIRPWTTTCVVCASS